MGSTKTLESIKERISEWWEINQFYADVPSLAHKGDVCPALLLRTPAVAVENDYRLHVLNALAKEAGLCLYVEHTFLGTGLVHFRRHTRDD